MNNFASWSVILVFAVYFVYGDAELLPAIKEGETYKIFYYDEPFSQDSRVQKLPNFQNMLGITTWKNDTLLFHEENGCYLFYNSQGDKKNLCQKLFPKTCYTIGDYRIDAKLDCKYINSECTTLNFDNLYLIYSCVKFSKGSSGTAHIITVPDNTPERE